MSVFAARHTALGAVAILLWSTNSAATVTLVRHLGPLTALALVASLAGLVLAAFVDLRRRRLGSFLRIGWPFACAGGASFVLYQLLYFGAFAGAGPDLVAPLNLVNYLWPGLTVLLCVARARARYRISLPLLAAGIVAGLAGIAVAIAPDPSPGPLLAALAGHPGAFLAMAGAAAAWAAFSALAVPLQRAGGPSGTPLFFLLTGAAAWIMRLASGEVSHLGVADLPLLAYTVLAPAGGAYLLWELAMRDGDGPLLGALGNALPLLSTLVIGLTLGMQGGGLLGLGAVLVALGAWLVHRGARRRDEGAAAAG